MGHILRSLALAALAAASPPGLQEPTDSISAEAIRAHLFFLSGDALEGRAPGTRGADVAADYIASRFMAVGLQTVGGSHFQDVPVTGITLDTATAALDFEGPDGLLMAEYPGDAIIWAGAPGPAANVTGELVFVGYGIDAPEWDWNDFGGRDLTGKVLLFLVGDPPAPPDDPGLFEGRAMTYYGRWSYKLEEARRRGAAGALLIHNPTTAGYDWGVVESSWTGEQLVLRDPAPDGRRRGRAGVPLNGWLTGDFSRLLLELAGLDLAELTASAARRDFQPLATRLTVRARMDGRSREVETRNVVGFLPGRTDQVVVLTAHYDHLGIGPAINGDSIYNGAYDNASGVSVLLEVAGALARADRPRRGILFLATTGEEAGLLGARHYVDRPLIPLRRTVAALNTDGANLWGETDDAIAIGAERSTLQEVLSYHANTLRITVRGDPAPQRGAFFRSDHFPFARAGIPAVLLQHGLAFRGRPAGWGHAMMATWQRQNYHRPSDELHPQADLSGAVQQARLLAALSLAVANAQTPPRWKRDRPFPGAAARDHRTR